LRPLLHLQTTKGTHLILETGLAPRQTDRKIIMSYKIFFLYAVLFFSGFAGLGYELSWTRMLTVGLGHEISAVLAVVSAFFCGLALGAWGFDRVKVSQTHPGTVYSVLEAVIGIWALALIVIIPRSNHLFAVILGLEPSAVFQWLVSFVFPFLLFLPATLSMGATLPVMNRFLKTPGEQKGIIGSLYAANTFGAVAGTVVVVLLLVPRFGHSVTLAILAAFNLACALGAATLDRKATDPQPAPSQPSRISRPPFRNLLLMLFITGLLGIAYEVLVVRLISQVLENTVYSFAAVLAVFLLGTAGGAAFYQLLALRRPALDSIPLLVTLLSGACLLGIVLLWHFKGIHNWLVSIIGRGLAPSLVIETTLSALVLLLPTLLMGATFSHLAQKAEDERIGFGKALGINTLGSSLAPLIFNVFLLPRIGSLLVLSAVSLGYMMLIPLSGRRFFLPALIPIGGCLIIIFSQSPMQLVSLEPGDQIIEHREGVMAAVTVIQDETGERHLKVNDRFQEGGTSSVFSDRRQGHIPLLLHPHPERALFLGLGTGSTLAAAADHPGLQAEGVELIPEVIGMLPYFEKATGNLRGYPSLRLIAADARRYVNARPGSYDVIVADLFHPARDGAGSLYTLEHFRAIRALLRPEGVFVQWLPLYQLDLETFRLITRTFLTAFPEGAAFLAHFSLKTPIVGLAARLGEAGYPENWFRQRVQDPALAEALRPVRLYDDFTLFGTFLAGNKELRLFAGAGPLNTDDHPLVTFQAPRFVYENQEPAKERLMALIRTFHPRPEEVLTQAVGGMGEDYRRRLAEYWTARNRFIQAGIGVKETRDLRKLLAVVKEPLLSIVRQSRDFEAAYNPLLGMAQGLYRIDPPAAERLLMDLEKANPYRDEARRLRQSLSFLVSRRSE
jgi:spermidine synthase